LRDDSEDSQPPGVYGSVQRYIEPVHLATNGLRPSRTVALKRIRRLGSVTCSDPDMYKEYKAREQLSHPNICKMLAWEDNPDDDIFLLLEDLPFSLAQLPCFATGDKFHRLSEKEARIVFHQVPSTPQLH